MTPSLSRRKFLAAAAAAAAGASLLDLPAAADAVPGPQEEYGWFPMGMQSYSLRHYKVDEALKHIQALGLHHVEFFGSHLSPEAGPDDIAAMRRTLRRMEIAMSSHGVNHFSKDHEKNRKVFEFADRAGLRNISADPDPDAFDSLDKLVAEFGIRIAIHNHGPGARYASISDVKRAVEGHHKWIGACADLGHFIRSGEDPVKAITELGDRLYGVHLKDFADAKADARGVILGKGRLDVVETFRALRKVRFPADGALSLEYEEKEADPIADIRACLQAASEGARKALEH
jgi:sugar phosphate isomerase/epimerase